MLYIYVIIFIVLYKYEQEKVIMIAYFGYQSCRETKSRLGHSFFYFAFTRTRMNWVLPAEVAEVVR